MNRRAFQERLEDGLAEIERRRVEEQSKSNEEALREIEKQTRIQEATIALLQERIENFTSAMDKLRARDAEGAYADAMGVLEPPQEVTFTLDDGTEVSEKVELEKLQPGQEAQVVSIAGTALYLMGRKDEGVAKLNEALTIDPRARDARRNLGQLLFNDGEYAEALDIWSDELADGYRDGRLLFLVGQARYELYHQAKNASYLESARAALEQVIVELPDDPDVTRWLAIVEYESERYDEAIRLFEVLLKDAPLDPEYLELLANCYLVTENYGKAIEQLELSASVKEPTRAMMKTLGDLYASESRPGQAARWLARAYKDDPSTPGAELLAIGTLYADAGDLDEAVRWLSAVPRRHQDYAESQSHLAYLHQDRGRYEKALKAFEMSAEAEPDNGLAWLAVGDIHLDRKDLGNAHRAYSRAAALPRSAAEGLAGLAEVEYAKKNLEQAVKYYGQALAASPGNGRLEVALREIQDELNFKRQLEAAEAAGAGSAG